MRLCHKEISTTTVGNVTTLIMCNRTEGHPGKCSRFNDCYWCTTSRSQNHRGEHR